MDWVIGILVASTLLNAIYFLPVIQRIWLRPAPATWPDEADRSAGSRWSAWSARRSCHGDPRAGRRRVRGASVQPAQLGGGHRAGVLPVSTLVALGWPLLLLVGLFARRARPRLGRPPRTVGPAAAAAAAPGRRHRLAAVAAAGHDLDRRRGQPAAALAHAAGLDAGRLGRRRPGARAPTPLLGRLARGALRHAPAAAGRRPRLLLPGVRRGQPLGLPARDPRGQRRGHARRPHLHDHGGRGRGGRPDRRPAPRRRRRQRPLRGPARPPSVAASTARWWLLAGFAVKLGILPLHVWLPLAHPVAPAPASAILSGIIVKAGLIGWLRFVPPLPGDARGVGEALLLLGLVTAFGGVASASPRGGSRPCSPTRRSARWAWSSPASRSPSSCPTAATPSSRCWACSRCTTVSTRPRCSSPTAPRRAPAAPLALFALPALALAAAPLATGYVAKEALKRTLPWPPSPRPSRWCSLTSTATACCCGRRSAWRADSTAATCRCTRRGRCWWWRPRWRPGGSRPPPGLLPSPSPTSCGPRPGRSGWRRCSSWCSAAPARPRAHGAGGRPGRADRARAHALALGAAAGPRDRRVARATGSGSGRGHAPRRAAAGRGGQRRLPTIGVALLLVGALLWALTYWSRGG
jgi:hypothetical protein